MKALDGCRKPRSSTCEANQHLVGAFNLDYGCRGPDRHRHRRPRASVDRGPSASRRRDAQRPSCRHRRGVSATAGRPGRLRGRGAFPTDRACFFCPARARADRASYAAGDSAPAALRMSTSTITEMISDTSSPRGPKQAAGHISRIGMRGESSRGLPSFQGADRSSACPRLVDGGKEGVISPYANRCRNQAAVKATLFSRRSSPGITATGRA